MNGIAGLGRSAPGRPARTTPSAGTFRLDAGRTEATAPTAPAPAVAPAATIPDDPGARDRRAASRARRMLSDLSGLQTGLLAGSVDTAVLHRLAEPAADEAPSDPVLADALAAIALRARVELARRGNTVATR